LVLNPKIRQEQVDPTPDSLASGGCSPPDPILHSMTRKCTRLHSYWTFLADAYAWLFGVKTKLTAEYVFQSTCALRGTLLCTVQRLRRWSQPTH